MGKREKLIKKIKLQGDPNDINLPSPLVSLEDFFSGNEDLGSIGCNLYNHPGLDMFYRILKSVRDKKEVLDVLIAIHEIYEEDEKTWPFSERIYIITSAEKQEVAKWVHILEFDEIEEGWAYGIPKEAPVVPTGFSVYSIWWD